MKKTKLLSVISALLLVFSLGACEQTDEDETTIESDSDSSEASIETGESSELENDESSEGSESSNTENDGSSDLPSNPEEFLESINDCFNYSVTLQMDTSISTDYITYEQYLYSDYDYDAIWSTLEKQAYTDYYYIYYSENTIEANIYEVYSYSFGNISYYIGSYFYVNVEDGFWEYIYDYNSGIVYYTFYEGIWTDMYYSVPYAYSNGVGNALTYVESGSNYDSYSLDEEYVPYLFLGVGTDFIYASPESNANSATYKYTYFYPNEQKMVSSFSNRNYTYNSTYVFPDTKLYATEYEITSTIYDVGVTDDSYALNFHEYVQSLIS